MQLRHKKEKQLRKKCVSMIYPGYQIRGLPVFRRKIVIDR
jgi:hypothetical protein